MTPAEEIKAETQKLETQITELVEQFEKRTGAVLSCLEMPNFAQSYRGSRETPLSIRLMVTLPQ